MPGTEGGAVVAGADVGAWVGPGCVVPVPVPVPAPGVPLVGVPESEGAEVAGRDVVGAALLGLLGLLDVLLDVLLVRALLLRELPRFRAGTRAGPVVPEPRDADVDPVDPVDPVEVGSATSTPATPEEEPAADAASAATFLPTGVPSSVEGISPLVAATAGPPTISASTAPPITGRRRYSGRGARCLPT